MMRVTLTLGSAVEGRDRWLATAEYCKDHQVDRWAPTTDASGPTPLDAMAELAQKLAEAWEGALG